jgi:DNA-binding GntR family transcriptional regulator
MNNAELSPKTGMIASEQIYVKLRSMIECGELKPGMRLIQCDLAKQLKTSHIPIVEAIRRLEHDGLVMSEPNRGAQVVDWSIDEMESAVMIRSSLEQVAARLCAVRITDEQRIKLKDLAQQFKNYAIASDISGCKKSDAALHAFIVKCSGSRLLTRMLNNSRVITNTIRNIIWLPVKVSHPDIHDALVEAIVSGDKNLAEEKAKEHIEELLNNLYRAIQNHRSE